MAVNDRKLRRWVVAVAAAVVVVECLERMAGGRRGLGVEVVGVIKVGDAMAVVVEEEEEKRWNCW